MKNGSINQEVINSISRMQPGKVFNYSYFDIYKNNPSAVAKALSRLAKSNRIQRVEKGVYFIPIKSKFGGLRPSEEELIKSLSSEGKENPVYETGLGAYNKLGLTTQVPNTITLASTKQRPSKNVKGIKFNFTKKNFDISKFDYYLLQLLDAVKDSKNIPDSTVDESLRIIKVRIKELTKSKLSELKKASLNYPSYVRAILGAIIETLYSEKEARYIKNSLNPLTKYKLEINYSTLPNKQKWQIT